MLCSTAAFKNHAVFGFWKGSLVLPDDGTAVAKRGWATSGSSRASATCRRTKSWAATSRRRWRDTLRTSG